jgi:hypothetical protein
MRFGIPKTQHSACPTRLRVSPSYIPPAEAEANYYAAKETLDMVATQLKMPPRNPGRFIFMI